MAAGLGFDGLRVLVVIHEEIMVDVSARSKGLSMVAYAQIH